MQKKGKEEGRREGWKEGRREGSERVREGRQNTNPTLKIIIPMDTICFTDRALERGQGQRAKLP